MYGSGLKKLGDEWGMKPADGKLCGLLHGFPVAMSEGAGYKRLVINLCRLNPDAQSAEVDVDQLLSQPAKYYRITKYQVNQKCLSVEFHDNLGTMGKIREYVDTEIPRLKDAGFVGAAYCGQCGEPIGEQSCELFVLNQNPLLVHAGCADALRAEEENYQREQKEALTEKRSSPLAPLGALIGGLVGCIPWVILYTFGYVASIAAVLIALGANLGHKLFGGTEGKARLILVIVLTLLLVPVANFAGTVGQLAYGIHTGELQKEWGVPKNSVTVEDALSIVQLTLSDGDAAAEFIGASLKDLGVAYLFAALGLWSVWKKLRVENVPQKNRLTRVA